jgi:hypothetical protein
MPNLASHILTFSLVDRPYADIDMILESMDGFTIYKSAGAQILFDSGAWNLSVGPTVDDYIDLIKEDDLPVYPYTWDKKRQLRIMLSSQIQDYPTQVQALTTGEVYNAATGFGLYFYPTKIQAVCGDGMDIATLDLITGITPGDIETHLYEFLFLPGNGLYINIDGSPAGSITQHLPTRDDTAKRLLAIHMYNETDGLGAAFRFSRIQFSQDK